MICSKKNPSKEYLQNISYYKEMHKNGFQRLDKFVCNQDAYDRISTRPFINIIKKIIFISVACYEASATLPNGQNAHINIQTYEWRENQFIKCAEEFQGIKIIAFCNFVAENDKMIHRCIEINDTFNKYS